MKIYFLPKSECGRRSSYLLLFSLISFAIFNLLIYSGQRGGEKFFDNMILAIPFILSFATVIIAVIPGSRALLKEKDYSLLIVLTIIIGVLAGIFISLELLFPH